MSEKKNIDRLFQEQFKDFEADPPGYVWENIREALEEKKKRRVIPVWFRLAGAAAVLLLGLFLGWDYLTGNAGTDAQQQVVTAPAVKGTTQSGAGNATDTNNAMLNGYDQVAGANNSAANPLENNGDSNAGESHSKVSPNGIKGDAGTSLNAENAVVSANDKDALVKGTNSAKSGVTAKVSTAVADNDKAAGNNNRRHKANRSNNAADNLATAVADNDRQGTSAKQKRKAGTAKQGTGVDKATFRITNDAQPIASAGKGAKKSRQKDVGTTTDKQQGTDAFGRSNDNTLVSGISRDTNSGNKQDDKINSKNGGVTADVPVIDKSATPEEAVAAVAIDTVKPKPENELEKLLREKEEGKKEEQLADASSPKWNIKPQVAPVFYNSLSGGSPIDGQFAGNAKSFDNDLSYGLGIDYALNKRLSVRTGVNRVNLNYATQGIEFYASLEGSNNNIATARSRNAAIIVQTQTDGLGSPLAANAMKESYDGAMVQTTGYVEVPLEVSYSLLNKRFGIAVIGGVSTLFLNENNVSVVSTQGLTTNVGEAENLNNIHFSTNVGLGFKYRFFKSFEANFEPTFKYQVNTYSRDAGNFKPYFIGLYSGISFSF